MTLCRLLGHRRERYNAGRFLDRKGRWRERWYSRCTRCGTSDGGEVFREGLLERFEWWRFRRSVRECLTCIKRWWRTDCDDCKRPVIRLGRHCGNHDDCDEIPF